MKNYYSVKLIVLFAIIFAGTWALTESLPIAAGVMVVVLVADRLIKKWADRNDKKYFG